MKISYNLKYYLISIVLGVIFWLAFSLIKTEFINIIFFFMAYIWHFSLVAPEMKEYALRNKKGLSLLTLVYKANFYLQMFIRVEKIKYTASVVRAISPLVFTFFLFVAGGSGNLIFTLLGSFIFELIYLNIIKKPSDQGIHLNHSSEGISPGELHGQDNHQKDNEKEI